MSSESTELTQAKEGGSKKLVGAFDMTPRNMTEAISFAKLMATSGVIPAEYLKDPGKILVAVQAGHELGLSPLQSLNSIAVIKGKPTLWGDAMLAIVKNSGVLDKSFGRGGVKERNAAEAWKAKEGRCEIKRTDEEETTVVTFSIEDAERALLIKRSRGGEDAKGVGPWITYPGRMLQMRARSWALRDSCPDVLKGMHIREEVQDIIDVPADQVKITSPPERVSEPREETDSKEVDNFIASTAGGPGAPQRTSGGGGRSAPAADPSTFKEWKGVIEKLEVKKTGNPAWPKLLVTMKDGTVFQTINKEYGATAKAEHSTGEMVKILFESNQYGKEIRGISRAEVPPDEAPEPGSEG